MLNETEGFKTRFIIDDDYNIIGCLNKEDQAYIGMKCYNVLTEIEREVFVCVIDKTVNNQHPQQISVKLNHHTEACICTSPIFGSSMLAVECDVCLKKKKAHDCKQPIVLGDDYKFDKCKREVIIDIIKSIPIIAVILDPNDHFKYLEWTELAEEISGIKRSDVVGKTRFDLYNLKQAKGYHEEDVKAMKTGEVIVSESEYEFATYSKAKSKHIKTYRLPVYDNDNKPLLLIVLGIDITKSIIKGRELLQAEKLSLIGQLASGIAHNIGNQLTTMNGALSVIKLMDKDQTYSKYMNYIKKAIDNSSELINQLLDFGRKSNFNQTEMNVHEILESTVEMVQFIFGQNIEIEIEFNAKWPLVKGDPLRLQNTVLNILINARDAMPGGGTIRVITDNEEENDLICIFIEDDGEGMEPEVASKAFDPFFTTKQVGKGTGMGLATAYGNIKQMNGSIDVDSCKGDGTIFTIQLPVAKDIKVS